MPNLEEMDEQQAHRFLTELLSSLSPQEEYDVRHQDYVMEMPQSGESIRGRERMREFQEAYPTPPGAGLGISRKPHPQAFAHRVVQSFPVFQGGNSCGSMRHWQPVFDT